MTLHEWYHDITHDLTDGIDWDQTVAQRVTVGVYVPANGENIPVGAEHQIDILPGSGIVGSPVAGDPGTICIDFEGNRYGADNIRTWGQKVRHAAERHLTRYPTVARAFVRAEALTKVGEYTAGADRVVIDGKAPHLPLVQWARDVVLVGQSGQPTTVDIPRG